MTSLVTGGAGFIGSNLVRALLAEGESVVVVDDFSSGREDNLPDSTRLTVIKGDITDLPGLGAVVRSCDYVFHLAAQVGITQSTDDPVGDARSNVLGTVVLLDACRGSGVRRIVCSSSAAVYGEPERLPIDEDHAVRPESFYALSKLASEGYAVLASSLHNLPTTCLRYFNVYGLPRANSEYAGVISGFASRLASGQRLTIYGDGSQDRDFVYVKDVVAANLLAARHGRAGAVYNIGTGHSTTILELAHLMADLAGKPAEIEFLPGRPGEVRSSSASIQRARLEVGYKPAYDLRSGLLEMGDQLLPAGGRSATG